MLCRRWVLLLAVACAPAAAQEIKHPSDVLPEDVLGYVELRQPGKILKELASLTEGSLLASAPDALAKLREKVPADLYRFRPDDMQIASAMLGVMTAPELAAEIGRIEGIAVAVVGIDQDKSGIPDCVGFVLPGDSNLPGIGFRMAVAGVMGSGSYSSDGKVIRQSRSSVEPIGKHEGVQLYQFMQRSSTTIRDPQGGPAKAEPEVVREAGPALARLSSGVILVGSRERVKDVIRRATRKGTEPSLAGSATFKAARSQLGDKPGLFAFGNPDAGLNLAEKHLPRDLRGLFGPIRDLVNPKVLGGVATSLTLTEGTLSYRWLARLDPAQKSPALEFLPSVPLKTDLLHFAPRDALFVAALSNGEGDKRWKKLLELADGAAKTVAPNVPPPSRVVAGAEGTLGFKIGEDLLGKIEALAVAMPGAARVPELIKSPLPPFVAILQATDEAGATKLAQEIIPTIVGTATLQFGVKPMEKKVGGETVLALELGGRLPTLVYGQRGSTLVLGVNEALVAESVTAGTKKQGYLADEKARNALQRAGSPTLLVLAKPLTMSGLALVTREKRAVGPDDEAVRREAVVVPPETQALLKTLMELAKAEEPLVISFGRTPEQLSLEASYPGLRTLVPKVMDTAVEHYFQSQAPRRPFDPPKAAIKSSPAKTPSIKESSPKASKIKESEVPKELSKQR